MEYAVNHEIASLAHCCRAVALPDSGHAGRCLLSGAGAAGVSPVAGYPHSARGRQSAATDPLKQGDGGGATGWPPQPRDPAIVTARAGGAEPERSSAGVGAGGEGQSCLCYQ